MTSARLCVLISGTGSNLIAIHRACETGQLPAKVVQVVCNEPDAAGIVYCQQQQLPVTVVDHRNYSTRALFEQQLTEQIEASRPDLILLAGFMRILTKVFVNTFEGALMNIHPSLLPRYAGLNTHARALADHQAWHGCSVHLVTDELDGGPVLARSAIQIKDSVTEAETAANVLAREHYLYPFVIGEWLRGNLTVQQGQVHHSGQKLHHPLLV